jgi:hypothetical protein
VESQSDVARQVAARALFGEGSEKTISELEARGKGRSLALLRTNVNEALLASIDQIPSLSDIDLVRFVQLSASASPLEAVFASCIRELARRQGADGLWSSIALTSLIVVTLVEGVTTKEGERHDAEIRDVVARAIEGLRSKFRMNSEPWGGVIQDIALAVQALGLFRATYDVGSQEIFESLEAESRMSRQSVGIGKIRVDLKELFSRDLAKDKKIRDLSHIIADQKQTLSLLREATKSAHRSMSIFRVTSGVSVLLLISLVASFWFGDREALLNVVAGTGSLLGLVIGALIAIPITYIVSPGSVPREPESKNEVGK